MSVTEQHMNARLEAAEARNETRFSQIMSEIKLISINMAANMDRIDARFERVDEKFKRVDERFEEMEKRFEKIDERFEKIDVRFDKVDARFEKVEDELQKVKDQVHDVRAVTVSMKWNILGAGLALGGLIIGIFAYGIQILDIAQALFTAGLNAK